MDYQMVCQTMLMKQLFPPPFLPAPSPSDFLYPLAPVSRPPHDLPLGFRGCGGLLTSPTVVASKSTMCWWEVATMLSLLISMIRWPTRTPPRSAMLPRIRLQIWSQTGPSVRAMTRNSSFYSFVLRGQQPRSQGIFGFGKGSGNEVVWPSLCTEARLELTLLRWKPSLFSYVNRYIVMLTSLTILVALATISSPEKHEPRVREAYAPFRSGRWSRAGTWCRADSPPPAPSADTTRSWRSPWCSAWSSGMRRARLAHALR